MKKILCITLCLCCFITIATTATHASSNYKQTVMDYLVNDIHLNKAAACGVMANIEYESDFNPTLVGDYGTSYGLCQWHNERWTNLKNYCNKNGYDWRSITGQLHFLKYELENNKSDTGDILNKLKKVENTASGAYTAAYNWCYYFERPANKSYESDKRGNRARNYYWPNYNATAPEKTQPDKAVNWTGIVTADTSLYLRKGPSLNAEALTTIPYGTKVVITAENGEWGKLTYNNITGYSYLGYIKKVEPAKEEILDTSSNNIIEITNTDLKSCDINGDSLVNSDDVMLILSHIVGIQPLSDKELLNADVNNDNVINSDDAMFILNTIVDN